MEMLGGIDVLREESCVVGRMLDSVCVTDVSFSGKFLIRDQDFTGAKMSTLGCDIAGKEAI